MTLPDLNHWHAHLASHFEPLAAKRHCGSGKPPVFALEHGLEESQIKAVARAIRAHIVSDVPSWDHRLPWIVYAAELGYRYSGSEYWQTFEEATPGWTTHGDRSWIRECYRWFQRKYGGAKPSGQWAECFTIICWPITHAVLPKDLQRQLARALYDIRHFYSQEVLASPAMLGDLIAERSWSESSRFQNLAQETELVGQIAAALLLEGESGTEDLLYAPTLFRISHDLDRERRRREWLRAARRSAKERATVRGLARDTTPTSGVHRAEEARRRVAILGIEPRLSLQPADSEATSWRVSIEVPDLSSLVRKFPNTRNAIAQSRCIVAGAEGRPIARGRFLYGGQQVMLRRWPMPDEVLLRFEQSQPDLEFLLRTECLLRPGPPWLFRIATDGLAYECRGLRVRPGQRYIVLTAASEATYSDAVPPVNVQCDGVAGALVDVPPALNPYWEHVLRVLGLTQARLIEVWPAGLAAVRWDGEGHGEWLVDEQPTLGIQSDHPLGMIRVSVDGQPGSAFELIDVSPGKPLFLELPRLPVGLHTIRIEASRTATRNPEDLGRLEVVMGVRQARPWHRGLSPSGPLAVRIDPMVPTLEELWDGQVDVEVRGPPGRTIECNMSLLNRHKDTLTAGMGRRLTLPITPHQWRSHFGTHFRNSKSVQKNYDASYVCRVDFSAGELGAFTIQCERDFAPLRWALLDRNQNPILRLIDDSGHAEVARVSFFSFEKPAIEARLDDAPEYPVRPPGGLYLARKGSFSAGIIALPRIRTLSDLTTSPVVGHRRRSMNAVLQAVEVGRNWGAAKSSGDILSVTNRRKALQMVTRHIAGLIGGRGWTKAEYHFGELGNRDLSVLKRAVTKRPDEVDIAETLAGEITDLARAPTDERVRRLAELVTEHGLLDQRGGDRAVSRDPGWLAEFALRIGSSLRDAEEWAGTQLREALTHLMEVPVLARAARFIVIGTDDYFESRAGPDETYAGWGWP